MLKLYNSISKKKEDFKEIKKGQISIYLCGVTVYDFCHIGHARTAISLDTIVRFLRSIDYKVKFVRNITDVDDKIINRAKEKNISPLELSQKMIKQMHKDYENLNILQPDVEPKVTNHMQEIIDFIEDLIKKDFAYQKENSVYFKVKKFKEYGKLSKQDIEQMNQGETNNLLKEDPLDFALWKGQKSDDEIFWDSPFGRGRPGWHIECSAMSKKHLGENFDIHAGGLDLIFPHHENEIAQSVCAHNKPYANCWIHTGMVNIAGEKMSKSLNNFSLIKDLIKNYDGETLRFFLLSAHYKKDIDFSLDAINEARSALLNLYNALYFVYQNNLPNLKDLEIKKIKQSFEYKNFADSMLDDFNFSKAKAVMFSLANQIHKIYKKDLSLAKEKAQVLLYITDIFAILIQKPIDFFRFGTSSAEQKKIEDLIKQRQIARKNQEYKKADIIRDKLAQININLLDLQDICLWQKIKYD